MTKDDYLALAVLDNKGVTLSDCGAVCSPSLTLKEWREAFIQIVEVHSRSPFWLGDLINEGERIAVELERQRLVEVNGFTPDKITPKLLTYGRKFVVAQATCNLKADTLSDYASVCKRIPLPIRNGNLSFSHHRLIAPLPPPEQRQWLSVSEKNNWKVEDLRGAVHTTTTQVEEHEVLDEPFAAFAFEVNKFERILKRIDVRIFAAIPAEACAKEAEHLRSIATLLNDMADLLVE